MSASVTVERDTYLSEGVTTKEYRPAQSGIHGAYFAPKHTEARKAALLLFGGSEAGNGVVSAGNCMQRSVSQH